MLGTSNVEAMDTTLTTRDDILQLLKSNLLKAQQKVNSQVDKHRSNNAFEVGDWYLKLHPYRHSS